MITFAPVCLLAALGVKAQVAAKTQPADPLASVRQAVNLAEGGQCAKALPVLKRSLRSLQDKPFRYRAAFAAVRCAMSLHDVPTALETLALLRRDFPDDAEALYLSARYLSQLGERSAQDLFQRYPDSPQVGKLNAEALESKQMWKEAIEAYRKVLAQDPKALGVHFRIAAILLDTSTGAEAVAEAKKELDAELEINPNHAAAVFALGEIDRRAGAWDEAIRHFSRAAQIDPGFLEAHLALGTSLNAAGKFADAIAPLERYAKGVPADPAGHYQLALAYSRTGNRTGAERELQLQREAAAKTDPQRPPTARVPQ
jgi:predicted Zn-dependent protease